MTEAKTDTAADTAATATDTAADTAATAIDSETDTERDRQIILMIRSGELKQLYFFSITWLKRAFNNQNLFTYS